MLKFLRRVGVLGTVGAGLGGWGGEAVVHAIGANHESGWRALEYVAGTGSGAAAGAGAGVVTAVGYTLAKRAVRPVRSGKAME